MSDSSNSGELTPGPAPSDDNASETSDSNSDGASGSDNRSRAQNSDASSGGGEITPKAPAARSEDSETTSEPAGSGRMPTAKSDTAKGGELSPGPAPSRSAREEPFITTWKVPKPSGFFASLFKSPSIFIPTAPGVAYDFTIDWGDGTVEEISGINPNPAHSYTEPGTYTVAIQGDFPRLFLDAHEGDGDQDNAKKLQSVEQWGAIEWQSMAYAFAGAENLSFRAEDTPDLSKALGMSWMFKGARLFRREVSRWEAAQIPFVTTWKTTAPDESIFIPTAPETEYDFTIDWGDGTVEQVSGINPSPMHTYTEPGTHIIAIEGDFPRLFLNAHEEGGDPDNARKLRSVEQWGTIQWNSMHRAFAGAVKLSFQAKDTPDFSSITSAFVTTWETTVPVESIFIPTAPETEYDFTIDWGDGTVEEVRGINPNPAHSYAEPGTYTVAIEGDFPRLFLNAHEGDGDRDNAKKLQTVEQWGTIEWKSMHRALSGAINLEIRAEDIPDLSSVTGAFVTTWQTTVPDEAIFIPTAPEEAYDFAVDWGDGTIEEVIGTNPNPEHIYAEPGTYTVTVEGAFPELFLNAHDEGGDRDNARKLRTVEQWGAIQWQSMAYAFAGASELELQSDGDPDLSEVTNMRGMFWGAAAFNQCIGEWDVSGVKDMSHMFRKAASFNQNIGEWDVSNVVDMSYMFYEASSFNQDISGWNVAPWVDIIGILHGAESFDPDHAPEGMLIP